MKTVEEMIEGLDCGIVGLAKWPDGTVRYFVLKMEDIKTGMLPKHFETIVESLQVTEEGHRNERVRKVS